MEFIKPFWDAYGLSYITLVFTGVIIAVMLEITVKKLFNSMIEKATDDASKETLAQKKATVSLISAVALSVILGLCVVLTMEFPAGVSLWVCWICIVYIVQFVTSLYFIPAFRTKLEAIQQGKIERKSRTVVRVIKNADGTYTEV